MFINEIWVQANLTNIDIDIWILDIKKLMNVDKPIETANGLPNQCYTSEQYLEYERDKKGKQKEYVSNIFSINRLFTYVSYLRAYLNSKDLLIISLIILSKWK